MPILSPLSTPSSPYRPQIAVSPGSRNTAWVSFDGRKRQELRHGDRSDTSFTYCTCRVAMVAVWQKVISSMIKLANI